MKTYIYPFVLFLLLLTISHVNGQGCSDAGFCTMGAMRPSQPYEKNLKIVLKSVELSQYVGVTRFEDVIYATTVDLNVGITSKDAAQFKIPYMVAEGPLGNSNGLGDISMSYTRTILNERDYQVNLTGGFKIPLGNSNESFEGKPLPMYYQQSLGTFDLVFGASFLTDKWLIATGYQHSLNSNENQFFWKPWIDEGFDRESIEKYPLSIDLNRGKDVMLRVERSIKKSNWGLSVGLLGIYRLSKDLITSPFSEERTRVDGSDGLALTAILGLKYNFNTKSGVKLIFGQRLIKRKFNPDGLSREQVLEIGYVYQF